MMPFLRSVYPLADTIAIQYLCRRPLLHITSPVEAITHSPSTQVAPSYLIHDVTIILNVADIRVIHRQPAVHSDITFSFWE